jgi:hypothetical protein
VLVVYLVDIHLITRPHRPELGAKLFGALFTLARTQLDEVKRVRKCGRCCTEFLVRSPGTECWSIAFLHLRRTLLATVRVESVIEQCCVFTYCLLNGWRSTRSHR